MPYFRYFDIASSSVFQGDNIRVLSSSPLVGALEAEKEPVESNFQSWWNLKSEDARVAALDGAPDGFFKSEWSDPTFPGADENGYVSALCSLETGEPGGPVEDGEPVETPAPEGEVPAEEAPAV